MYANRQMIIIHIGLLIISNGKVKGTKIETTSHKAEQKLSVTAKTMEYILEDRLSSNLYK